MEASGHGSHFALRAFTHLGKCEFPILPPRKGTGAEITNQDTHTARDSPYDKAGFHIHLPWPVDVAQHDPWMPVSAGGRQKELRHSEERNFTLSLNNSF